MARGLETLWYKRQLMNPFKFGGFAWRLISHKLCRWLVFLTIPCGLLGLALLATASPMALALLVIVILGIGAGALVMRVADSRRIPRPLLLLGFVFAACLAALIAWSKALRGERNPIWEPTRRPS
jgi:hypothetical protein